jgi:hypothetical protein
MTPPWTRPDMHVRMERRGAAANPVACPEELAGVPRVRRDDHQNARAGQRGACHDGHLRRVLAHRA